MAMVLRRADLAELVAAVAETLDGAVLAAEPDGTPLAKAGPAELLDRLPDLPPDDPGPDRRRDLRPSARKVPAPATQPGRTPPVKADRPQPPESSGSRDRGRNEPKTPARGTEAGQEPLVETSAQPSDEPGIGRVGERGRDTRKVTALAAEADGPHLVGDGLTDPADLSGESGTEQGRHADEPGLPEEQTTEPGPGRLRDLGRRAWTVPVRAGAETFGHLLFAGRAEPLDTDKRILERSAQTAALLLLVERQMAAAEQQVRGQLVDELLAEREPDWAALRRRAKASGAIDFSVRQTVLVVSATGTTRRRLLRAAADYVRAHGGVATEHRGHVVLLIPCADATAAVRAARRHLERATGGTVTAGVAGPAATAPVVRSLHREAERCHRLLVALGRAGTAASLADLGVLGLVLDGASREHIRRLVEDSAGPILAYDAEHGSLLAETLDGYFAAGENPRAAARRLQVHANTVYQRLDRVDQVLGHRSWREPAGALTLRIALQLRRVIDQIPVVS
ncbi:helix-turn-helix domain-containing protein [Amycolatopsis sp. NPDC023774]|uniref:PucR family transcriptional regulator n=1 Tax=Amycolatopsis sp. NPDC023774 TaxID=3155015 RepID=UPI0033F68852